VANGLVGCLATIPIGGRLLESYPFNVTPFDPVTIVGATLALMAMAGLASAGPAIVAVRTDPVTALRDESR
jgi:ABC-type antimicrobial peptide transport system permease subunit